MSGLTIETPGGATGTPIGTVSPGTFTLGINLSGMEYDGGPNAVAGTNYVVPSLGELAYYKSQGEQLIRLPISWESMQSTLGGPLSATYLANVESVVNNAAALGIKVILDIHDFGGYHGQKIGGGVVTDVDFANLWQQLAKAFADNPGIGGYDLMNEPSNMPNATAWTSAAQAAITAIRTVDTATPIYVEGNDYANAQNWAALNPGLAQLHDPSNNLIFSAHVYLDSDDSGTHFDWAQEAAAGVTTELGVQRLSGFVAWLHEYGLRGNVGEVGAGNDNTQWLVALNNTIAYAQANNLQTTYWAGGPWWGSYPLSVEPHDGVPAPQMAVLDTYADAVKTVTIAALSGTAAAGSTVYLSENDVLLATTVADPAGNWSTTLTGLAQGVHVIVAGDTLPGTDGTIAATAFDLVSASGGVLGNGAELVASQAQNLSGITVNFGGTVIVSSGGSAAGTVVNSGGLEVVLSGGTASRTSVANGGTLILLAGGTVPGLKAASGADVISTGVVMETGSGFGVIDGFAWGSGIAAGVQDFVLSNGAAEAFKITSGGLQTVDWGGVASTTAVGSGGVEMVVAGGQSFGAEVAAGGVEKVDDKGAAIGAQVASGGQIIVSGGLTTDTSLARGATEILLAGGITSATVVAADSLETVSSGGRALGAVVAAGGCQVISAGGYAQSTALAGSATVMSGGIASGTIITSGGWQIVSAGGAARHSVVNDAGYQIVAGITCLTTVNAGGTESVYVGGGTHHSILTSGGVEKVYSGGRARRTVVLSGGDELVSSGGETMSSTVSAGGYQTVYPGGLAEDTVVSAGGKLTLVVAGAASGTTISSGGWEAVSSGGKASLSNVLEGGLQTVISTGVALSATVAGTQVVSAGGSACFTTIASGGAQIVMGGGTASETIIKSGGTETLMNGAAASAIDFDGANATLQIGGTSLGAVLSGFDANGASGDDIVLTASTYSSADTVTVSPNNVLVVGMPGKTMTLQLNPTQSFIGLTFGVETNSAGFTEVFAAPAMVNPVSSVTLPAATLHAPTLSATLSQQNALGQIVMAQRMTGVV